MLLLLFMSERTSACEIQRRIQPRENSNTPKSPRKKVSIAETPKQKEGSHVQGMHCCSKLAGRNSNSTETLANPRNNTHALRWFLQKPHIQHEASSLTSLSSVEWTGSERLGSSLLTTSKSFFTSSSMVFPATSRRGRAIASSGMEHLRLGERSGNTSKCRRTTTTSYTVLYISSYYIRSSLVTVRLRNWSTSKLQVGGSWGLKVDVPNSNALTSHTQFPSNSRFGKCDLNVSDCSLRFKTYFDESSRIDVCGV